ncbi:type II secretion system F family protein [Mucilaginibacter sp.]
MPSIDLRQYEPKKGPAAATKAAQASNKSLPAKRNTGTQEGGLLALLNRDISFGSGQLSDKKKEYLYLELSTLLQAGVNLKSSFELVMADDQHKGKDKALFEQVQQTVLSGTTFSQALQQSGRFSLYEVFSLQIGEETGKLIEVLQDLAKYYQAKIKQRRKIISALTYPCIVMATSLGAVVFMLKYIVPMFGDVFKRFGGHLPWVTEQIIRISQGMERYFLPFFLVIAVIVGALYSLRKGVQFRRVASAVVLRLPVVGSLVQKIYLARLCNALRLLISARLPLLRAIALIRQMISFYPLEHTLGQVEEDIMQGKSLHQSLGRFKVYPAKLVQLVKVGEETGKLEDFFARLSQQYVDEVEHQTSTLSSMMEPLIIIFLGLVVGIILISMYLPLFQMSNSFQ